MEESATKIYEQVDGKKYECVGVADVEVSRYDFINENGRLYGKALWENVIKNQKHIWEGSVGLADHPGDMDEGSVKNIFGVWHNLHLNESTQTVMAELRLVGPHGKLAREIMEAGGKIGFSSSGFGELKEDGRTVDPSSYMIERISDFVLNPSQKVFGTINNVRKESKETVSMNESTNSSTRKISKLEERKFRKDVEGFLQEASAIAKPADRLADLHELLNYFEDDSTPDLKARVQEEIKVTEKLLGTFQEEQIKLKEELGVDSVGAIKEGIRKIVNETQLFEKQSKDWKKIAEGLQVKIRNMQKQIESMPTPEQFEESQVKLERMKRFINQREQLMKSKIDAMREELDSTSAITDKMSEEFVSLNKKLDEYKKVIVEGSKAITELEETVQQKDQIIEQITIENESIVEAATRLPEFKPSFTEKTSSMLNMNEHTKVESYYKDLVKRHGKRMEAFRTRIMACKTLSEAAKLYVGILAEIDSPKAVNDGVWEGRKQIMESVTGRHISDHKPMKSRLPSTWE